MWFQASKSPYGRYNVEWIRMLVLSRSECEPAAAEFNPARGGWNLHLSHS